MPSDTEILYRKRIGISGFYIELGPRYPPKVKSGLMSQPMMTTSENRVSRLPGLRLNTHYEGGGVVQFNTGRRGIN